MTVHAASFDCMKAQSEVEHLICDNPELSKLDDEMLAAYKATLKDEKDKEAVRQSQINWLKYRNNCKDADCVKRAYEMRLSSLTVTHVYDFTLSDTDEEKKAAVYTSGSIDMREPGYPFKLIEGKGVEVCDIYKKNLEALGNANLACERKVSPEYEGLIKLPDWRKLDLWENRNLWVGNLEGIVRDECYSDHRSGHRQRDIVRHLDVLRVHAAIVVDADSHL